MREFDIDTCRCDIFFPRHRCWSSVSSPLPPWRWCWTRTLLSLPVTGWTLCLLRYTRWAVVRVESLLLFLFTVQCSRLFVCSLPPQENRPFFDLVRQRSGQPRSLQHLCRCALHLHLGARRSSAVTKLNIPSSVRDYLLLCDDGTLLWLHPVHIYFKSHGGLFENLF